ncbi:MAG: glycosyltransferase family 39 protein [Anaerolineae bacterium]|nr:glycosyltransferase family 39 protein [Anaerolineae bacterium]
MKTLNISAKQWERAIYIAIFLIGVISRISLAFVNREANDPHMEVVQWILTHNDLPIQTDDNCWECFQPKLYYFTTAVFLHFFSINNPDTQIIIAQLLNSLLGIVMLGYAYFLIQLLPFEHINKLLAFGLITLNPGLVGINVQATNDTFAISFSFIAIYYAFRLVTSTTKLATSRQNKLDFILVILFTVLAILAKTNAIVTAAAILIAFLVKAFSHQSAIFYRRSLLFLLATSCLVIFNPLSQYIVNYQTFGTPITLTINIPKQPLPHIFEKTETHRPGILSIQDGFFTFRIIELIRDPQINRSNKNYPIHRTSFWAVLYGRTHFIQYNQWPQSWITTSTIIQQLGRLIYLFALLPSLAFIIGLSSEFLILFKFLLFKPQPDNKRDLQPTPPSLFSAFRLNLNAFNGAGLFFALTLGYLGFQILYALQYRIYTVIKAIFIYPAWPAMLFFYLAGAQILYQQTRRFPWIFYIFIISNIVLIGLYILDSLALLLQLTN